MEWNFHVKWQRVHWCVRVEKLHEESFQKCKEVAKQFKEEEEKLEILTKEISELSEELCSLKKQSPEVASLLSDFTPFRDIPLQVCVINEHRYYSDDCAVTLRRIVICNHRRS